MEPGIYHDFPEADYHGDPALSSTFARLLTEHTPAKALALRKRKPTKAMNLGKAVHARILGSGPELVVYQHDGRTREGKAEREEYRGAIEAETVVAVTQSEVDQIEGMAARLAGHSLAQPLLASGDTEVSAWWIDAETGVNCRGRFDVLPEKKGKRRLIVPDYKTTASALTAREFGKTAAKYGYHQQAEFYLRGIKALGLDPDPTFVFVVQETAEPFEVGIFNLDRDAMDAARILNDRALRIFRECTESGVWPGLPAEVYTASLPAFYYIDHEEQLA